MADPTTDCDQYLKGCKSKCFDTLFNRLVQAAGDAAQEQEATEAYKKCVALCKKAKEICDSVPD
jgi:hypothetical protein